MEEPFLEAFKARFDGDLGSLTGWLAILPAAGNLNWVSSKVAT